MIPQNKNLTFVRGDTLCFGIALSGLSNEVDEMTLTVKESKNHEQYIFQKTIGNGITMIEANKYRIRIAPEDTAYLDNGSYEYDLEIQVNGDTYTVLMGKINLMADVTRLEHG